MTQLEPSTTESVSPTLDIDPDRDFRQLAAEHDELFEQCGADDVAADLVAEMCRLEYEIVLTSIHTAGAYAAKEDVIDRANFDRCDQMWIETALRLDRLRIWPQLPDLARNESRY